MNWLCVNKVWVDERWEMVRTDTQRTWVVAYDIRQDRRRVRVAKQLETRGIRLQKSVFLVEGPPLSVRQLIGEIAAHLDPGTDQVCAWPLSLGWRQEQQCRPPEAAPLQETFVIA
jgi:CRISPR-associated endonuclease Cas2